MEKIKKWCKKNIKNKIIINFLKKVSKRIFSYKAWILYQNDFNEIKKQMINQTVFNKITKFPILFDKFDTSGTASGHYFHQDIFIAQRIYLNNPVRHVDIGSRIDGFVAHVASFRKIEVIDIRPLKSEINNIIFTQANIMEESIEIVNCCDSISSLHAIEHFGLGRYGDPIKVNGYLDGLNNIYKMLKQGGKFYFSVPIGEQKIEFNAHRVFSLKYLLELLEKDYIIDMFSYVDDCGDIHKNIKLDDNIIKNNAYCNYGCGIFELTKR